MNGFASLSDLDEERLSEQVTPPSVPSRIADNSRCCAQWTSAALDGLQVPTHMLRRVGEGAGARLQIEVSLPGVSAAAELIVLIRERSISVRVPGRYKLV